MDLAKYQIYVKNDEKLKSPLELSHGKRNYYICKRICELATNSFVVSYENWFGIEIGAEQNENLLKDLTSKFYAKILKSRRVEETIGHHYKIGNLY